MVVELWIARMAGRAMPQHQPCRKAVQGELHFHGQGPVHIGGWGRHCPETRQWLGPPSRANPLATCRQLRATNRQARNLQALRALPLQGPLAITVSISLGLLGLAVACSRRLQQPVKGAAGRLRRARNAAIIAQMRRIWRRSLPKEPHWRGPSALDLFLRELRSRRLTTTSEASVVLDLMLLRKAFREAGGCWPSTGRTVRAAELEDLAHFMRFASAAYGSLLTSISGMDARPIWRWLLPGPRRRAADAQEIRRYCSLEESELLHYSDGGRGAFHPAWFLAHDPATGAGVLAVRGTITLSDILTDVAGESAPFEEGIAHRGFLSAARELRAAADAPLGQLFAGGGREARPTRLVVCGHSLGAACAVLLAIILRREQLAGTAPFLKDVHISCLTYGCPPVLKLNPGAESLVPPVLNVVHRFDWISRLQLANVLRLVEAVANVEALGLPPRRKMACIAGRGSAEGLGLRFKDLYRAEPGGRAAGGLELPGRTVWLYDACGGVHTRAEWADARLSAAPPALDDPVRAVLDHLPTTYEAALRDALQQLEASSRLGCDSRA